MMSTTIRTVQLKDKQKNPISPYTPGSAVYFQAKGTDGKTTYTNLDTKIGGIDIDRVEQAHEASLDAIEDKKDWAVNKITEEGSSYENEINELSGVVKTLEDKVFPLEISMNISANLSTMKTSFTYNVTEFGTTATGANINVTQASNSGSATSKYSGTNGSQTLTLNTTFGRDVFRITAVKGNKSDEKAATRYVCLYGSYGETMTASALQNASIMSRVYTSSAAFTCTVNTTTAKPYIWIAVPEYINVNRVTSSGFDVTMRPYISFTVGSTTYKAYRCQKQLQQASWPLVIS